VAARAKKDPPDRDPHLLDRGGFVTTDELAAFLRKAPGTLDQWVTRGYGPKFSKPGRDRLYDCEDVKAWLAGKEREQEERMQERRGAA
jgi:hypothetical protein